MEKFIIGIDPGFTETGVVLYRDTDEGDVLAWCTYKSPVGRADAARAASLAEHIIADILLWVDTCGIKYLDVCIETPVFGRNVAGFGKQMRLIQEIESGLLFRLAGELKELWVTEIGPTQVKVLACNDGRASKGAIIRASPIGPDMGLKIETREALADAWAIGLGAWGIKGKRFKFSSVRAAKVVKTSDTKT